MLSLALPMDGSNVLEMHRKHQRIRCLRELVVLSRAAEQVNALEVSWSWSLFKFPLSL
jgi:hypothetical protein